MGHDLISLHVLKFEISKRCRLSLTSLTHHRVRLFHGTLATWDQIEHASFNFSVWASVLKHVTIGFFGAGQFQRPHSTLIHNQLQLHIFLDFAQKIYVSLSIFLRCTPNLTTYHVGNQQLLALRWGATRYVHHVSTPLKTPRFSIHMAWGVS